MTLEELDAEARMHGLHVWQARDRAGRPASFNCAIPDGRHAAALGDTVLPETLHADTIEDMAAKLNAYYGRGKHAAGPAESEQADLNGLASPYIGKRRA